MSMNKWCNQHPFSHVHIAKWSMCVVLKPGFIVATESKACWWLKLDNPKNYSVLTTQNTLIFILITSDHSVADLATQWIAICVANIFISVTSCSNPIVTVIFPKNEQEQISYNFYSLRVTFLLHLQTTTKKIQCLFEIWLVTS